MRDWVGGERITLYSSLPTLRARTVNSQHNVDLDDIVGPRVVHAHSVDVLDLGRERHGLVGHELEVLGWGSDAGEVCELF